MLDYLDLCDPVVAMLLDPAFAHYNFVAWVEPDPFLASIFATDPNCREVMIVPIPWFPEHAHA